MALSLTSTIAPHPDAYKVFSITADDALFVYGGLSQARLEFLRANRPGAALKIATAIRDFDRDLRALAERISQVAEREIIRILKQRQKRPDTGRGRGLEDNIVCAAFHTPLSVGGVLIGLVDDLDKTIHPHAASQAPYWRAQEYGLSQGFVGRQLRGLFMGPGYSSPTARPDPTQFRQHPLFVPTARGGKGVVANPIEPKFFLRDGTQIAAREWLAGLAVIQARLTATLRAIR